MPADPRRRALPRSGQWRGAVVHGLLGVDDPLVDLLHLFQVPVHVAAAASRPRPPRRSRSGRHLARQHFQLLGLRGQHVGLPVVGELQPVLQVAQELVGRREPASTRSSESRPLSRRRNKASMEPPCRTQGSRPPCSRCRHCTRNSMSRMPPRASLMSKPACQRRLGRQLLADSLPRGGHRLDGGEVQRARINARLDGLQEGLAQGPVARRDARLDQHLQLPVPRAALVVLPRAVERKADARPSRPSGLSRRSTR